MLIAIIDKQGEPDVCAEIVRAFLPFAACLITPTVRDIWETEAPVPRISGVLVHGAEEDLGTREAGSLSDIGRRFPLAFTVSGDDRLAEWASRCVGFPPQLPRQPDRLPWKCALVVHTPGARAARLCATGNVSLGGVYIADPRAKPSVGTRVSLRFPLVDARITATAVVRWVQPKDVAARQAGYGCEFSGTDEWIPGILVHAARQALGKPLVQVPALPLPASNPV